MDIFNNENNNGDKEKSTLNSQLTNNNSNKKKKSFLELKDFMAATKETSRQVIDVILECDGQQQARKNMTAAQRSEERSRNVKNFAEKQKEKQQQQQEQIDDDQNDQNENDNLFLPWNVGTPSLCPCNFSLRQSMVDDCLQEINDLEEKKKQMDDPKEKKKSKLRFELVTKESPLFKTKTIIMMKIIKIKIMRFILIII
jgi:hypothetical protein